MLSQVARASLVFILLVYRGKWCQALDGVDDVIRVGGHHQVPASAPVSSVDGGGHKTPSDTHNDATRVAQLLQPHGGNGQPPDKEAAFVVLRERLDADVARVASLAKTLPEFAASPPLPTTAPPQDTCDDQGDAVCDGRRDDDVHLHVDNDPSSAHQQQNHQLQQQQQQQQDQQQQHHTFVLPSNVDGKLSRRLQCLRPIDKSKWRKKYDDTLLSLELEPGRACSDDACQRCGIEVVMGLSPPKKPRCLSLTVKPCSTRSIERSERTRAATATAAPATQTRRQSK